MIKEEMTTIFQKEGLTMLQGGMVSISKVLVTPDLLEARIHLSFFQVADPKALLQIFREKTSELRGALGNKLRFHLRRIPELQFFSDDTLEHVSKIEALLEQVKKEDEKAKGEPGEDPA